MAQSITKQIGFPELQPTQSLSEYIVAFESETPNNMFLSSDQRIVTIVQITDSSLFLNEQRNEPLVRSNISREGLTESFTQPSRKSFLKQKLEDLSKMYALLEFENEAVLEIGTDIIQDCLKLRKLDILISRTGDNELLIFREVDGTFNNIIIDDEGDIEFLHIPTNRAETYNEHFSFVNPIDTFALASKL